MRAQVWSGGRLRRIAFAAGLGARVASATTGRADGDGGICPRCHRPVMGHHKHPGPPFGTLGYGPPGLYPGFQGFGLGYHPG